MYCAQNYSFQFADGRTFHHAEYFSRFGFVIYDDIHNYMTPSRRNILWRTGIKYSLGLLASENSNRWNMGFIFEKYAGPMIQITTQDVIQTEHESLVSDILSQIPSNHSTSLAPHPVSNIHNAPLVPHSVNNISNTLPALHPVLIPLAYPQPSAPTYSASYSSNIPHIYPLVDNMQPASYPPASYQVNNMPSMRQHEPRVRNILPQQNTNDRDCVVS
jgi:hypothetical protein